MITTCLRLAAAAALIWALLYVSSMDLQDARADDAHYIENVCAEYWPNYKNIQINCDQ